MELKGIDLSSTMFQRVAGRLPEEELFHLPDDPYQLNNLADDPKWEAVKQRLKMQLKNEQKSTGDPRITGNFEEVFYGR